MYPPRSKYKPSQVFRHAWGVFVDRSKRIEEVRVELDRRWIPYAMHHRWHPSQKHVDDPDGRLILRFEIRVCPEFKAWVRSFGTEATVLEPQWLANELAQGPAASPALDGDR